MKPLPPSFTEEMQALFRQFGREKEWPDFQACFRQAPAGGLRANTLKISRQDLQNLLAAELGLDPDYLAPVTWSDDGLYLPAGCQPGKLASYAAGLYYIQEPSAMLPAAVLAARPGDRILDLCAAPGGKTCRIAADLRGEGLLWANDVSAVRVRALLHNVELTGCANCLITQETPQHLAQNLPGYFDRVLVDAPCSGSGMFRRDPSAIESWLAYGSAPCTALQISILEAAWTMLRPGGRLVYSTCSFSLAENEALILGFIEQHPESRIVPIHKDSGVSDGLPLRSDLTGTARIWPHQAAGEGHYCALLQKDSSDESADVPEQVFSAGKRQEPEMADAAANQVFADFCRQNLSDAGLARIQQACRDGWLRCDRGCLHLLPAAMTVLSDLKKVKTGLYLGQMRPIRGGRLIYEPSQSFLLSLKAGDLKRAVGGTLKSDLIRRYLHGETISFGNTVSAEAGEYSAVVLEDMEGGRWPLGWVKPMPGGHLKNLYPQAWRHQT
ncbi:MAG TPA: SAM-dependent methyltransferase [Clostridiales bacterium]|nr:SAM-dependent methyltransferase [Clostridiales bacterium]